MSTLHRNLGLALFVIAGVGCAGLRAKQQHDEEVLQGHWQPPPEEVTTGELQAPFRELRGEIEHGWQTFRPAYDAQTQYSNPDNRLHPAIPPDAEVLAIYPSDSIWQLQRHPASGLIERRTGQFVVVYKMQQQCWWTWGLFFQENLGANTYGPLRLFTHSANEAPAGYYKFDCAQFKRGGA